MAVLEKRIRWLQTHPYVLYRGASNNDAAEKEIKQLKEELTQLRSLPLYSSKITGYKFVCSSCYDDLFLISQEERKKK